MSGKTDRVFGDLDPAADDGQTLRIEVVHKSEQMTLIELRHTSDESCVADSFFETRAWVEDVVGVGRARIGDSCQS